MSVISRLYNFVAGSAAVADQVDAEFDQIVAYLNASVVLKDGTVAMTGALTLPADPTLALQASTKQYVDALIGAPAVAGFVGMWGGSAVPAGWLACDGAAVSRATYATLFAAVGTTHGAGDGVTTFNVPDLRGRVPVGAGAATAVTTARSAGQQFGVEAVASSIGGTFGAGPVTPAVTNYSTFAHVHAVSTLQPSDVLLFIIRY